MKFTARPTAKINVAVRITAPEFKKSEDGTREIPLLCWGDESGRHHREECAPKLFLRAAGDNAEGEKPDGFDRLIDHRFYLHYDATGKIIGMDVIPSRKYASRVIPTKMVDVDSVRIQFDMAIGLVRVIARPYNADYKAIRKVIRGLEAAARSNKAIAVGMRPVAKNAAEVVAIESNVVEVRMSTKAKRESVYAQQLNGEPEEADTQV